MSKKLKKSAEKNQVIDLPIAGIKRITEVKSIAARSGGKLLALNSCISFISRFARLSTSLST